VSAWWRDAIWWHVYPLGFLGALSTGPAAPATPAPLRRLEPWLDYLISLGANGLMLGPVFASEHHGYETVDHLRVDPRLGTESDLEWLFDACHQRGIRVLLDGVFHHVARSHPAFADVLEKGRESDFASWFRLEFDPAVGPDGFTYADFEGHRELVALNHAEPAVLDYVVDAACHWLKRGADGFRLDAAYAVPTTFWRAFADKVRSRHPDTFLLGEVLHGDYASFAEEAGLDSVTQYELWKAMWSSCNDTNLHELAWALDRHATICRRTMPLTFPGNHDVTRIASQLTDPTLLGHVLAVLLTVPGLPAIYAGDEQAFRGVKRHERGGDDDIRPVFPDHPDELAPYGRDTFALHQELIGLRRRHPWLATGRLTVAHVDNSTLAYQIDGPDGKSAVIALNLDHSSRRLSIGHGPREAVHRAGANVTSSWSNAGLVLDGMPARTWSVLIS
jgi:cyclomaltodextrinase